MHSIKSYLRRRSTDVLELLLLHHQEGTEELDEETARYIETLLQERKEETPVPAGDELT